MAICCLLVSESEDVVKDVVVEQAWDMILLSHLRCLGFMGYAGGRPLLSAIDDSWKIHL